MVYLIKEILQNAQKIGRKIAKSTKIFALPVKIIVYWYVFFVALCLHTYYFVCLIGIYFGFAKPSDFLEFIKVLIGSSMLLTIGFLIKCFIDRDKNGIPDQFEEQKEKREKV